MSEFKNKKQLRSHKVVVALNDDEKIFIDNYCNKNNIKSKGKFLRETAIRIILKQMHQYSPTVKSPTSTPLKTRNKGKSCR